MTAWRPLRWRTAIVGGLAVPLLALVGCSGGAADESAGLAAPEAGVEEMADGPTDGDGSDYSDSDGATDRGTRSQVSFAALAADRQLVVSAGLVVQTDAVITAAHRAETIAVGTGGMVTDEETTVDPVDGATVSSLTLRVPPEAVETVLAGLADLGTLVSQTRSTDDITDEYVDVEARLASARESLDRLLELVGTAGALDDVIALENEIAQRQADLDALAARQQAMDQDVSLATIALTLVSEEDHLVAQPTRTGFLGGLQSGWEAFTAAIVAGLTVLGALLPFLLAAVLLGGPVWLLVRRRRRPLVAPSRAADAPTL